MKDFITTDNFLRENCIKKISEFFKIPEKLKLKKINLTKDYDNIIDFQIKFKNSKIEIKKKNKKNLKNEYILFSKTSGFSPILENFQIKKNLKKITPFKFQINSINNFSNRNFSKKNTKSSLNISEKNFFENEKKKNSKKKNFLENENFLNKKKNLSDFFGKEDFPFKKENLNCSLINIEKYKLISTKKNLKKNNIDDILKCKKNINNKKKKKIKKKKN